MALELYIEKKGRSTCVALVGEFEVAGVEQLKSRLERYDDDAQPVLDLRRIVVVDAAAIQSERDRMSEQPGSRRRRDSRA